MPSRALLGDAVLNLLDQALCKPPPRLHEQEQHDALVRVSRPALPHTDAIGHVVGEEGLDDRVNFRAAEAHA